MNEIVSLDLKELEKFGKILNKNKYDSLEDLEKTKKEEARKEIGRQY